MNHDEASAFVVSELGKHHSRNEIIITLCERMKINWQEAEQLIQEVEAQNSHAIAARQSPILLILGVSITITGIVMIYTNATYFIDFLQTPHDTISLDMALDLSTVYYRAGSLFAGICMLIGGLIGSWKTLSKLLNK